MRLAAAGAVPITLFVLEFIPATYAVIIASSFVTLTDKHKSITLWHTFFFDFVPSPDTDLECVILNDV